MKRVLLPGLLVILSVMLAISAHGDIRAQEGGVPTLVPPTPVPTVDTGEGEVLPSESAVARIEATGRVRVGVLYNAPPFGWLNVRGVVAGYDSDVVRSMAELWDVEVEFVQVTRDRDAAIRLLRRGEIDMLAAALVHDRELDSAVEFSQTYYTGGQSLMVRADDAAQVPADIAGRRIGVVIQTPSQEAVNAWLGRTGIDAAVQTFLTLDRAFVALAEGRIDGVVDTAIRLRQVSALHPETIRILDEPIEPAPHAIAVVRQDVSMRNLVNRTLQYLTRSGRMNEVYQVFFTGMTFTAIHPWPGLGDDPPSPSDYATGIDYPAQYAIPQMLNRGAVRVAGLYGVTADSDAPESERRLDALHRSLVEEMARRWGVRVEYVPDSANNALELVAAGQADIAVGVEANWTWADRVDFTNPYLLRGERLMVRVDDDVQNFTDLRGGGVVVTPNNETTAATRAVELAESVNVRIEIIQAREQDLAFTILEEDEAEVAFGDSIRLIPHVREFPELLRLTTEEDRGGGDVDRWYTRRYVSMAVPCNDIDMRLLVEYTLQELIRDGTLEQLLQPVMQPDEIPEFEIWPGPSTYLGFTLDG